VKLPTDNPLFTDETTNANQLAEHNTSVPYLDWATPTLFTTITVQMSEVLGGKTSVSSAIGAVQADDTSYRSKLVQ
jgi:raffinose/stachyose/melibiose transport system substrate-binding protein